MTGSGQDSKGAQAPGSPKPPIASAETQSQKFVASQGEPEVATEPAAAAAPAPVDEPFEPAAEPVIEESPAAPVSPPVPPSPTAATASKAGTDAVSPTPPSQDFFPSTSSSPSQAPAPTPTLAPSSSTTGLSKVEELRARLAKQKTERERLLKSGTSAAPAAEASQQDETF